VRISSGAVLVADVDVAGEVPVDHDGRAGSTGGVSDCEASIGIRTGSESAPAQNLDVDVYDIFLRDVLVTVIPFSISVTLKHLPLSVSLTTP
jgi:hypothetical protein